MHKILIAVLGAIGALIVCSGWFGVVDAAAKTKEEFHETYYVEPGIKLNLSNKDGSITIRRWDETYISVSAKKKAQLAGRLDNVKIESSQTRSTFTIKTVKLVRKPRVIVIYDVHIPAGLIVNHVETSDGDITLEDAQGDISLKTSDGDIVAQNINGHLEARTSDGDIILEDVNGDVALRTSDGKITVKTIAGAVEAETSDGDIVVEKADGSVTATTSDGDIVIENVDGVVNAKTSDGSIKITGAAAIHRAETSDGSITVELPATQNIDASIETNDGSIELFLASELNVDLELRTSDGKIQLHDLEILASEISKNRIKGKLGDGGKRIYAKASDGDIHLFRLE